MSRITPPTATPARLRSCNAIGYRSHPCPGADVTRTVVEHLASHCLESITRSSTEWEPKPNEAVKLTLAKVEVPPEATTLVCTAAPSLAQTTTNPSPSPSATWTESVATIPVAEWACSVVDLGHSTAGPVLLSSYAPMSIRPRTMRGKPR